VSDGYDLQFSEYRELARVERGKEFFKRQLLVYNFSVRGGKMNRLKELRVYYNKENPNDEITQAEMARRLGMTRQGYAKIESGRTTPDVFTGIKIARIFKQRVDAVFVVAR
jgi:DNA-binding XRE family transcriptional regulator